jgi:isoquinoline 1-oxidoreductase beta subunit
MQTNTRRAFIRNTTGAGFGLFLGLSRTGGRPMKAFGPAAPASLTPFVRIDTDGSLTIFNVKPEMGQGTFQSIPALIAEELEVSLDQVKIVQTNGEPVFGRGQRAGGSSSVRTSYTEFRKVGASAREMLVTAAAKQWGVEASTCHAENGNVFHTQSGRSLSYGELAEMASKLDVPKEPKLKDAKDFKILGKSIKRPDVPLKVNGTAGFGIDVELPGMYYASVQRSPVLGGTLKKFDATAAMKVKGVVKVVEAERTVGRYRYTGVAVIAENYWAAVLGRKALKIEWDNKGYDKFNSTAYEAQLRSMAQQDGVQDKKFGSPDEVRAIPERTVRAFYETPMIAHHALEPMNCTVQVQGDKLEIWTSTQVPASLTDPGPDGLPKHTGFAPENVTVHNQFIGGGFGRRLYLDFISEAVNVAKQIDKPVKVIWSREDTTQFGPFRPMTFSDLQGVFGEDGKLLSLRHKVISPSYFESQSDKFDKSKVDNIMVEGIGEQEYEIPNLKTSYVRADLHVPIAAWRSVTSSTLAYAHECFIDELAHAAKQDPMAFRLGLLTKDSDTKRVLLKLKEVSGWDDPLPKGRFRGMAHWKFFAGQCAQVVEVRYDKAKKSITVYKVYAVIDLGAIVNPDTVKGQVEGAIVMALGAATNPGITFDGGKVQQSNFHDTPVPRLTEVPKVEVHILAEGGKIKGVGEPGLPPFAPALVNAIFAATGKRHRRLPIDLYKMT